MDRDTYQLTQHSNIRQQQRGLKEEIRDLIFWYGQEFRGAHGATHMALVERELPPEIQGDPMVVGARDWVLVVSKGILITCYRRRNAVQALRRQSEARAKHHSH